MAGYNEILTGRYNRALQKLLSMKGPASMNELSSVVYPSFPFFWGVEMRYLESWAIFGQAFRLTAGAGFNPTIRFRNPTSNVIAVFTQLILGLPTGGGPTQIAVEGPTPTVTDLATNISPFCTRFDARGQQATTLAVSQDATAAHANNGNTIVDWEASNQLAFTILSDDSQEIPLLPGDALQIRGVTLASSIIATVWWRERQLEDSELK